jgi:hypothetical protein
MPIALLWIAGIWGAGYVLNSSANLLSESQRLAQVAVAGGVVYVAYKVVTK